jgi:hypothetical protein
MVISMHRKAIILCLLVAGLILNTPIVGALDAPDITFVPSQISVNSSFLVIAEPDAEEGESVLVNWLVGGLTYGSFPKVYGKWMCYFSSTDTSATCGPAPFTEPGSYTFVVSSMNQHGEISNQSQGQYPIDIGNIRMSQDILKSGNDVSMVVYPSDVVDGVSYSVYSHTGDLMSGLSGDLEKDVNSYVGDISLSNGEYYIAFEATSPVDFGGTLAKVFIGSSPVNGGGDYQLDADPVVWNPIVQSGGSRTKSNNQITNTGTSAIANLSTSIPSEITRYIDIDLSQDSLNVSESAYYTLTLTGIYNSMDINTVVDILSETTKVGEISLDMKVSVINETGVDITCDDKSDLAYCIGGICCSNVCREKSNCCSDTDCATDEECVNYLCREQASSDECSGQVDGYSCTGGLCCSGRCRLGADCCTTFDCPIEEECSSSYTCVPMAGDDCEGVPDGSTCSLGVCFTDECVECYMDYHCQEGEVCNANYYTCGSTANGDGGGDYTLIIITVVVIVGGLGAFLYFKKFRKSGSTGEEEYKEEGEESFSDEEFY